ncbi:MAG: preprotein translocase subunit SecE [Fidelibacterota bacterium]
MFEKIKSFLESVRVEMNKVSWPSWEELKGSTYIVLSLSLMLAVFLFIVDFILNRVIAYVL